MTFSFAAGRSFLSFRFGRFDLFAQRETAPAARHAFTCEGKGAVTPHCQYAQRQSDRFRSNWPFVQFWRCSHTAPSRCPFGYASSEPGKAWFDKYRLTTHSELEISELPKTN